MLVLASQSPRRREILAQAGLPFIVRVSGVEEVRGASESPEAYVRRLARDKARAVASSPDDFVLAADTVVVVDDSVLEKPASGADAAAMLLRLSGRSHVVLTGVCLVSQGHEWSEVESTRVYFSRFSEAEIRAYCASGEPMDKAGAYAIQGLASKFIERIEGCYFNVVGLPVSRVYRMLKLAGYSFNAG